MQLDPDVVADVVEGELTVEMFGRQTDSHDDSHQDVSSATTTHSAYHAVSPHELSLRLHELIQSRLEERVKELEVELQNKEMKLQSMESENSTCNQELADSMLGSSRQQTPIALPVEESNPIPQVSAINLSEDAYNEVEDYLTKEPESEPEDYPSAADRNYQSEEEEDQRSTHQFDESAVWDQNGRVGDSMEHSRIYKEKERNTFVSLGVRTLEEHILMEMELSGDEDDDEDGDEDEMKLLIQQIVEKNRQGSPMVLNAQRAFFSVDENEH